MNEEILKRLDLLAAKLSTTTEHLWSVLVRQARIAAIEDGLFLLICLFVSWLIFKWTRWCMKQEDVDPFHYIGICVFGVFTLAIIIVDIYSLPTELFNPEYYALKEILNAVK